jgi:triosephosphate isomerase
MKKIIIANWKMNPQKEKEAVLLAKAIDKSGVIIAPPFVFLAAIKKILKRAKLAAQDIAPDSLGSLTGEISPAMLKNFGVKYAIIGHSERRALGETDILINKKIKTALKSGIVPVVCVGESHRDHQMKYLSFMKHQIAGTFKNLQPKDFKKIIIAYEPVWAIGKDAEREATPEESQEMAIFIKKVLSDIYGSKNIQKISILYGGSVNAKNAESFLKCGGVEGLLIGRSSLNSKEFNEIIKHA